jgi:hypothetical protein
VTPPGRPSGSRCSAGGCRPAAQTRSLVSLGCSAPRRSVRVRPRRALRQKGDQPGLCGNRSCRGRGHVLWRGSVLKGPSLLTRFVDLGWESGQGGMR